MLINANANGIDFLSLLTYVAKVMQFRKDEWLNQQAINSIKRLSTTLVMPEHGI